jgi:hypothetical protein
MQNLAEQMLEAAAEPFDLKAELPIRAHLFRITREHHALLLVLHHIATDAWSRQPLFDDLGAAYSARASGREPAWEGLPVQYADYSLWQAELLGENGPGSITQTQSEYWRAALADMPSELRLPRDRPRSIASSRGAVRRVRWTLPSDTVGRILELAQACRATVFMVLHAAVAGLLTQSGAGNDIPLGCPTAGRSEHALRSLIGCFVNTLVLRIDTAGNPSLRELVLRARKVDLAAYRYQDLPFDSLVSTLNPDRTISRQPLFQAMLVMEEGEIRAPRFAGLHVTYDPDPVAPAAAKFDLAFGFQATRDRGINCYLEYDSDVFDAETVDRLSRALGDLLERGSGDWDRELAELVCP